MGSGGQVIELPLADAAAREAIASELDINTLVEAGAGSGKTTVLVDRMVQLIVTGKARVGEIAAVTFTRKAATELRERFQGKLESAMRERGADDEGARIEVALSSIHDAFVGTIHSFCARLLRERSVEAGLDPAFTEVMEGEERSMRHEFWRDFIDRMVCEADPALERFLAVGLEPDRVAEAFRTLVENPDVEFAAPEVDPPDEHATRLVRKALDSLLDEAMGAMPSREPSKGWDSLQKKLLRLSYSRDVLGWGADDGSTTDLQRVALFDALALLRRQGKSQHRVILNRWLSGSLAKAVRDNVNRFSSGDSPANLLLDRWYAHRYALAIHLASKAAREFAVHRRRVGRLTFTDLLVMTAELLRNDAGARRHLGLRYRRLFVDEFQDTDPLQAEIVLLLASEPVGAKPLGPFSWRDAVPRPGALFVVGDPKQSIYRFRRADIQMYADVKRRFERFGQVLNLTTNFRSCPPIGDVANHAFSGPRAFGEEATEYQAAFAPLDTRPCNANNDGSYHYSIGADVSTKLACAAEDARCVAAWIAGRIADDGTVSPGSFLVITYNRRHLRQYAEAMERYAVPYQVTGAGVSAELELTELRVLLECLVDPTDPVKVVAVLTGFFFGIDYRRLVKHRLAAGERRAFDIVDRRTVRGGDEGVDEALRTLEGWWLRSIDEPADIFVAEIVAELGLLPHAAAGELGSQRAGGLAYALDSVRNQAYGGDASLLAALDAITGIPELRDAEAPLEPGRPDVVRIMNLHQAKGLEGDIVLLADPADVPSREPVLHTDREVTGRSVGYMRITESAEEDSGYRRQPKTLAQPLGWSAHVDREKKFEAAERVRLLYVAATRARKELVVSSWVAKPSSPWAALHASVRRLGTEMELKGGTASPPPETDLGPEEAARRVKDARKRIRETARPTYRTRSITELAKSEAGAHSRLRHVTDGQGLEQRTTRKMLREDSADASLETRHGVQPSPFGHSASASKPDAYGGKAWGSAVHRLVQLAGDGASTELLGWYAGEIVRDTELTGGADRSTATRQLLEHVEEILESEPWRRARHGDRFVTEANFAIRHQDDESNVPEIRWGSVDLAFREADGWVLVDYKTDDEDAPGFRERLPGYRTQLDLYSEAWVKLTDEPVKERILYFTRAGRMEMW